MSAKSFGAFAQAKPTEHDRQHTDNDGQTANDRAQRDCESRRIETDQASFFRGSMDHVQRVEQGAHSGIGAPYRHQQSDHEGCAQRRDIGLDEVLDLLLEQVDDARRYDAGQESEALRNGVGISEQAVERDDSRQRGEYRHEREKGDTAGGRNQPVPEEGREKPGGRFLSSSARPRPAAPSRRGNRGASSGFRPQREGSRRQYP